MSSAPTSSQSPDPWRYRRQRLAKLIDFPAVVWSGQPVARNFPANSYPFRANSHFLYLTCQSIPNAAIYLDGSDLTLFMDDPPTGANLWHGPIPDRQSIAQCMGANRAYPLDELDSVLSSVLTHVGSLPVQDRDTQHQQQVSLGRPVPSGPQDHQLSAAIVQLRLHHDAYALAEIRRAATVAMEAHRAGMAATPTACTEAQVRAAMEQVILAHNMTCAYASIVTTHGEVLHNQHYHHPLQPHDLLLADVGAEAESGWASDLTRTWPVGGRFSSTQRDIYDLVLAVHNACIEQAAPGIEYRDLHLLASRIMAAGLVDLGILNGEPDGLVERDMHALFFPHGIGHLLGLDVHDMEDLGDVAGYAPGRCRSSRFGLQFLRLDRPLAEGMVVTIEPGFYQVPAILQPARATDPAQAAINWDRLARFQDVRGIRIENDLLITATGHEVLTAALPTDADAIEALVVAGLR